MPEIGLEERHGRPCASATNAAIAANVVLGRLTARTGHNPAELTPERFCDCLAFSERASFEPRADAITSRDFATFAKNEIFQHQPTSYSATGGGPCDGPAVALPRD